ncbi:MAG: glycerate kinase [Clostridia bacterium]|nr:glycerate kinase [Clostridia bacterium]
MKIIVAPDSFKGSLDSERICRIVRYAAKRAWGDDCIVKELPLADGGEGTAALLSKILRGTTEKIEVEGPYKKPVKATVGFIDKGNTAIIESAQAIGLPLAGKRANPEKTSSYGVGQMISYATSRGAKKIILTLGGSCTNDLGAGMLSAMGVQFIDICGNRLTPVGGNLSRVESIEFNQSFSKYREVKFLLMCDVKNPLLGENGAAAIFAPQKGATPDGVDRLEKGAKKLSQIVRRVTGTNETETAGAGAAGGIGFGAMSFLRATVNSGIDLMLDLYEYDKLAEDADLVITGEGRLDSQSFMGKAVGGVLERSQGKRCAVFCGSKEDCILPEGVTAVSISDGVGCEYAMENAAECLQKALDGYFGSLLT